MIGIPSQPLMEGRLWRRPLLPALRFGAATTDYVAIPAATSINNLAAFTVAILVCPTTITHQRRMFAKGVNLLECEIRNSGAESNRFFFNRGRVTAYASAGVVNGTMDVNTWQLYLCTFDLTDGPRVFKGTDTTPMAECSYTIRDVGSGALMDDSGSPITVGNRNIGGTASFQGPIASFALFPARHTLDQLLAIQQRILMGHRLREPSVVDIPLGMNGIGLQCDWSGRENHGSVSGPVLAPGPLATPGGLAF